MNKQLRLVDFAFVEENINYQKSLKIAFDKFCDIESKLFQNSIFKCEKNDKCVLCNNGDPLPFSKNGYDRFLVSDEIIFRNLDNNNEYVFHIIEEKLDKDGYTQLELQELFKNGIGLSKSDIEELEKLSCDIDYYNKAQTAIDEYTFMERYDHIRLYKSQVTLEEHLDMSLDVESTLYQRTEAIETFKEYFTISGIDEVLPIVASLTRLRNDMIPFEIEYKNEKYYLEAVKCNTAFFVNDFSDKIIQVDLEASDHRFKREFLADQVTEIDQDMNALYVDYRENGKYYSYRSVSFAKNFNLFLMEHPRKNKTKTKRKKR